MHNDSYYQDDYGYDDRDWREWRESRSSDSSRGPKSHGRSNINNTSNNRGSGNSEGWSGGLQRPQVARELKEFMDDSLLFVLKPSQLNILNQVFRPIMCGKLVEVTNEYVVFKNVNIKMSNAPEFIFPTPLIIPLVQMIWFMPFDYNTRFPLY